jgi:hypothetical protein
LKLPFLAFDYTAGAIDISISHCSMENQAPKQEHLMKIGIVCNYKSAEFMHSRISAPVDGQAQQQANLTANLHSALNIACSRKAH